MLRPGVGSGDVHGFVSSLRFSSPLSLCTTSSPSLLHRMFSAAISFSVPFRNRRYREIQIIAPAVVVSLCSPSYSSTRRDDKWRPTTILVTQVRSSTSVSNGSFTASQRARDCASRPRSSHLKRPRRSYLVARGASILASDHLTLTFLSLLSLTPLYTGPTVRSPRTPRHCPLPSLLAHNTLQTLSQTDQPANEQRCKLLSKIS